MQSNHMIIGELLEGASLTLDQLARAASVEPTWVVERVRSGLLMSTTLDGDPVQWRFSTTELVRLRCMVSMERDMQANPELAALVADLLDEVRHLRRQLRAAGLTPR